MDHRCHSCAQLILKGLELQLHAVHFIVDCVETAESFLIQHIAHISGLLCVLLKHSTACLDERIQLLC